MLTILAGDMQKNWGWQAVGGSGSLFELGSNGMGELGSNKGTQWWPPPLPMAAYKLMADWVRL
jgi:hypothetical protein